MCAASVLSVGASLVEYMMVGIMGVGIDFMLDNSVDVRLLRK